VSKIFDLYKTEKSLKDSIWNTPIEAVDSLCVKMLYELNTRLKQIEDKIYMLENIQPYNSAKEETKYLEELKAKNLYDEGWY